MPKKDKKAKIKARKKARLTSKHEENRAIKKHLRERDSRIAHRDVAYLDDLLLDDEGRLKVHPSATYENIPHMDLRYWAHLRAFYGLPTTELVEWLQETIGGQSAIEVGSGNGVLGRALDIPRTDSIIQRKPEVMFQYMVQGQPIISYGSDVERLEAMEAVNKYNPQVVLGMWVTHWIDPNKPFPEGGGSMYGLHEDRILDHPSVEKYIVIGHKDIHNHKPILGRPHEIIEAPWLWSRARDPEGDRIYVWEG